MQKRLVACEFGARDLSAHVWYERTFQLRWPWPRLVAKTSYVAVAVAAAGAIVHMLRGRRGKTYPVDDKYP